MLIFWGRAARGMWKSPWPWFQTWCLPTAKHGVAGFAHILSSLVDLQRHKVTLATSAPCVLVTPYKPVFVLPSSFLSSVFPKIFSSCILWKFILQGWSSCRGARQLWLQVLREKCPGNTETEVSIWFFHLHAHPYGVLQDEIICPVPSSTSSPVI